MNYEVLYAFARDKKISYNELCAAVHTAMRIPVGATRCERPPEGWWCSRPAGHEGPCAARPTGDAR